MKLKFLKKVRWSLVGLVLSALIGGAGSGVLIANSYGYHCYFEVVLPEWLEAQKT
jgi:hypothetical protein